MVGLRVEPAVSSASAARARPPASASPLRHVEREHGRARLQQRGRRESVVLLHRTPASPAMRPMPHPKNTIDFAPGSSRSASPSTSNPFSAVPRPSQRGRRTRPPSEGNGRLVVSGARLEQHRLLDIAAGSARSPVKSVHSFRWLSNDTTATWSPGSATPSMPWLPWTMRTRPGVRVGAGTSEEEDDQASGRRGLVGPDHSGRLPGQPFRVRRRPVDPVRGLDGHRTAVHPDGGSRGVEVRAAARRAASSTRASSGTRTTSTRSSKRGSSVAGGSCAGAGSVRAIASGTRQAAFMAALRGRVRDTPAVRHYNPPEPRRCP